MGGLQVTHPWGLLGLLLVLPTVALARRSLAGLSPSRARLALTLRLLLLLCLSGALAGLQVVRRAAGSSVVWVVDRSDSIPPADRTATLQFVAAAQRTMRADDTAGTVVVGRTALVERLPEPRPREVAAGAGADGLPSIASAVEPQFTDLAAGLRLAVATVRPDARRRVVLLSDGNENLGDALSEAAAARAAGVAVDVWPLLRRQRAEVVAERLVVPTDVRSGDLVEPRVVLQADVATAARVTLLRDNQIVAALDTRLTPGKNLVAFPPLRAAADGFQRLSAVVEATTDGDRRNNRAVGFTFVRGRRRVLYVEGDRGQERYLTGALRTAGLEVRTVGPDGLPAQLPELAAYDGLILSNVSALDLSDAQMVMIRSAVRDLGVGLLMIGGDESFGAGGYYQTPVEEALPVDMDIRKMRHVPNVGVAIVIDKSGSMGMTEGGIEKIQLANEAANAVISLLTPRDQIAVIAVDSVAKPVTGSRMMPLANREALIRRVSSIRAGGGGIYCFNGLQKAAQMLQASDTKLRHIILFADSSDSEQQEGCRELVGRLARQRVTTTVVALGRPTDCDVAFLKDLARLGKGRYYITNKASALPRIFTREAVLAARSQIIEQRLVPQLRSSIEPLRGLTALPPLLGYIATTAKPGSEVGLLAPGPHKDPILATWQYGLGRAVAFTSDCKARWGRHWVGWDGYLPFWSQTVRWMLRRTQRGEFETQVITRFQATGDEVAAWRLRRGEARVVVDAVDAEGRFLNELALHGTAVSPTGQAVDLRLRQTAPGRYEATFAASEVGVWLINVGGGRPGRQGAQTIGLALAYPPEYRDLAPDQTLLQRLAQDTGGDLLRRPEEVFVPRGAAARAPREVWWPLLLTALWLFPLDIAVRRLVVDWRRWRPRRARPRAAATESTSRRLLQRQAAVRPRLRSRPALPPDQPAPPAAPLSTQEAPPAATAAPPERGSLAQQLRASQAARRSEELAPPAAPGAAAAPPAGAPPLAPAQSAATEPAERDVSATLARLKQARQRRRDAAGEDPESTP
ncbi:MAG: VWA domain-containing protein [Fimbriimonadaceae bacterium]|nr:VWA domain-containing protein [Fimbriimonadaceae bacterium]